MWQNQYLPRIGWRNVQWQTSRLETWIDDNPAVQRLLEIWQSLGDHGAWQQDAFMLCVCLAMCIMLFLAGTVFALFLQSLWWIFTTSAQQSDKEQK